MAKMRMAIVAGCALIACGIILVVIVSPRKPAPVPVEPAVVPQPVESATGSATTSPPVVLPAPAQEPEPPVVTAKVEEPAPEVAVVIPPSPTLPPPVASTVQEAEDHPNLAAHGAVDEKEAKLALNPPSREALVPILSPYRGSKITILVESGDPEDLRFAEQLKATFMKSGWGVNGVEEGVPSGPTPRIYLLVPDEVVRGRVAAVLKGMESLGTDCPVAKVSYLDKDELELRVGNRP